MKMRYVIMKIIVILLVLSIARIVYAEDLADLVRDGYIVVEETRIVGEFSGCELDKQVHFENGRTFICATDKLALALMPAVKILKHAQTGDVKVLIANKEYAGYLVSPEGVNPILLQQYAQQKKLTNKSLLINNQ